MPTVGHEPAPIARPAFASSAYTSPSRAPGPIVTVPSSCSSMPSRSCVLMTSDRGTPVPGAPPADHPVYECPPARSATGVEVVRAKARPACTSVVSAARRIPRGSASSKRGFSSTRASSHPAAPDRSTVPVTAAASASHESGPRSGESLGAGSGVCERVGAALGDRLGSGPGLLQAARMPATPRPTPPAMSARREVAVVR